MSDKVKLLELANLKVADNMAFIAFYLVKYSQIENVSNETVMSNLNCNYEKYYKLGLCKVPNVNADNYVQQLNDIAAYIEISSLELNKIIRRVNSILTFINSSSNNYLQAARDKSDKKKDD